MPVTESSTKKLLTVDLLPEEFSSPASGCLTLPFSQCLSDMCPLSPTPLSSLLCEYNPPSGLWQPWLPVSSSPAMLGDLGESPLSCDPASRSPPCFWESRLGARHCSLTRHLCPQTLISETVRRFGRLDCVVNNAGYREL